MRRRRRKWEKEKRGCGGGCSVHSNRGRRLSWLAGWRDQLTDSSTLVMARLDMASQVSNKLFTVFARKLRIPYVNQQHTSVSLGPIFLFSYTGKIARQVSIMKRAQLFVYSSWERKKRKKKRKNDRL